MNIVSRDLSVHQEHEVLLKFELAGLDSVLAQEIIQSKDNKLAKDMIQFALDKYILSFEISSLSLLVLRKARGLGEKGFRKKPYFDSVFNSESYKDMLNYCPEEGIYEINLLTDLVRKVDSPSETWDKPHPSVISQMIFIHYDNTGERILENSIIKTSEEWIHVGRFTSEGLIIHDDWHL